MLQILLARTVALLLLRPTQQHLQVATPMNQTHEQLRLEDEAQRRRLRSLPKVQRE